MQIGEYFVLLQYVMIIATFIALVFVFLYLIFAKEEKEES
jgi:hypothetical protein